MIGYALTLLTLMALGLGATGSWWPAGDALTVLRLPLAAMLVVLTLRHWARRERVFGAISAIIATIAIASTFAPTTSPGESTLRLYQKNVLYFRPSYRMLIEDILAQDVDIVTLQEVRHGTNPLLLALGKAFPHQARCNQHGYADTALLSRLPFRSAPHCALGQTFVEIETDLGPLWVASLHLKWPYPYAQAAQARALAQVFEEIGAPILLAGDFNNVSWSHTARSLRRASQTHNQGTPIGTLPVARQLGLGPQAWPALPIDHVFVPTGWGLDIARRPNVGSDHLGLVAQFGPS